MLKPVKENIKMTPENFCYWLQGYFEISRATGQPLVVTDKEIKVIEEHLQLVFKKETRASQPSDVFKVTSVITSNSPNKNGDIFPTNLVSFSEHPQSC
jgi:hypothetical protein